MVTKIDTNISGGGDDSKVHITGGRGITGGGGNSITYKRKHGEKRSQKSLNIEKYAFLNCF